MIGWISEIGYVVVVGFPFSAGLLFRWSRIDVAQETQRRFGVKDIVDDALTPSRRFWYVRIGVCQIDVLVSHQ